MSTVTSAIPFAGFRPDRFVKVPVELFDEWLAVLSWAELKVLLYIIRRTAGFGREADAISLSQMLHGQYDREGQRRDQGTGVSKPTLLAALRSLQARGLIHAERRRDPDHGDLPTVYRLVFATGGTATPPRVVSPAHQGRGQTESPDPWANAQTAQKIPADTQKQQSIQKENDLAPLTPHDHVASPGMLASETGAAESGVERLPDPAAATTGATPAASPADLWVAVQRELALELSPVNYRCYVAPARLIDWSGSRICLAAPSPAAAQALRTRLRARIERALAACVGGPVQLEVQAAATAA
jgi:DNA-binding transcriptional ArsR family regulator